MRGWFEARVGKRVVIDTILPGENGHSYVGAITWVSDDAVELKLTSQTRMITFHAIESVVEAPEF